MAEKNNAVETSSVSPGKKLSRQRSSVPSPGLTLADEERVLNAYQLQIAGASFWTIAEQLGYSSASAVKNALDRFMERNERQDKPKGKQLQIDRANHLLLNIWEDIQGGSISATHAALAIMRFINELEEGTQINVHHDGLPEHRVLVISGDKDTYIKRLAELVPDERPALSAGVSDENIEALKKVLDDNDIIDAVLVEEGE